MRNKQLGVSLGGLLMVAVVLIAIALLGFRLAPSYLEFFAIKKAVIALASEKRGGGGSAVAEIRRSFDLRATVDDISSIKGADLEVTKDGADLVVSATYRKDVPLFGNLGVYIEFIATSKQ